MLHSTGFCALHFLCGLLTLHTRLSAKPCMAQHGHCVHVHSSDMTTGDISMCKCLFTDARGIQQGSSSQRRAVPARAPAEAVQPWQEQPQTNLSKPVLPQCLLLRLCKVNLIACMQSLTKEGCASKTLRGKPECRRNTKDKVLDLSEVTAVQPRALPMCIR